ncbi:alpha-2-macroglobulin [Parasulfuritortus cantonensis]|uniref:Alpha-2-macroglobulin n=1 Tax=Parasulfuritortus cantonensis TaxID=2528202 RepID=A0A4R1BF51_9PROT|nr:MG2 domain-containing protein [Parasulfuritortus cantonensis]TCJ15770.1 alpha-2-macroglobulin [Parasulfuritortus cantonensis]
MRTAWSLLAAFLLVSAAHGAGLESFTPQGVVSQVRQVQARFDGAMAPLGKADTPAPFTVECAPGQGYWADERTWVYDFAATPAPGTACSFTVRTGLTSLAGEAIPGASYGFRFAGPQVVQILPDNDARVDENQAFVVVFDGPVDEATLTGHGHCAVEGIYERIPIRRLSGQARATLVKEWQARRYDADGIPAERVEVVQCARPLPANAKLALVWQRPDSDAVQSFEFTVRDQFVAHLRCTRENARAGCMPLEPVRVEFTAQVARDVLDRISLTDAAGKRYAREPDDDPTGDRVTFPGPFPPDAKLTLSLPDKLTDDAGRALLNQDRFPVTAAVAELPPLVKFSGDFGIIERHAGGLLPITLRNLEPGAGGTGAKIRWLRLDQDKDIADWWRRLHDFDNPREYPPPDRRSERLLDAALPGLAERTLPKPNGAKEFEIVGLPLEKPGYYVLEAESRYLGRSLLGADKPMYVRAAALVTNLAVHFKWGAKNSLAWVTSLDQGQPVAGARIAVNDCKGTLLAKGVTDAKGMAFIPAGVPDPRAAQWDCPLLVSARTGDDLGFARSDWDDGIESWRFNLPSDWRQDDRLAHSVLDRSLFKPGETVHMKHILRDKRLAGLGYPKNLPKTLMIEHEASGQRWFLPLTWQAGAAVDEWRIPATAKRGAYGLRLVDAEVKADTPPERLQYLSGLDSGRFTVADFRVPLMKAALNPVRPDLTAAANAEEDVSVAYLNGGAAKNLPVRLRAQMSPRHGVSFAAWPDYVFAQPADGSDDEADQTLDADPLTLDAGGAGRGRVVGIPARAYPQQLAVELEYTDPNGEIQTVSRRQNWWPADVVVGFKRPDWVKAGTRTTLEFATVDTAGKALAGIPVSVHPVARRHLGYRVRLVGGFYGYREETQDTPLEGECSGVSDAGGHFACTVTAPAGGQIIVGAEARDPAGRLAVGHASLWVAGRDEWWFDQENHDRIDLLPEKKTYAAGETARFQVRMPFRSATALVTVERDGILDARVVPLSGQAPVLELPVSASWAPNVYVSALVVRGRVDAVAPTAFVDLGKPAYKLGVAGIEVDQRGHRLDVRVTPERDTYQTRDQAKVRLAVKTADGKPLPADTQVIVAAVDEGLLELADNKSWDLLPAMMAERGYAMRTFTAQSQVTGKRHFGKKALPAGGGGGRSPTRELFDTLLYWNPAVKLDNKGEATVAIPLNDSLTRFRIVAVAASESRFGTGWSGIRATRDLQISAGLAPLVREGDRIEAHFTVRNGTARTMRIAMGAQASGLGVLAPQRFELAPGDGKEVSWPITVPAGRERLDWYVNARDLDSRALDAVKVGQAVQPVQPVRLVAGQLYRLDKPLDLPVAAPDDAIPGRGELRATLAASLGGSLVGVREYMRRYPYACLEQKTSKAVAGHDTKAWDELMEALPGYLDGDGLAAYFPGMNRGSVALTAYLLSISQAAGYAVPAAPRLRMEAALANYLAGRLERPAGLLPSRADGALRLAALAALARAGKAGPELVATVKPSANLWPAGMLIDWIDVLKRTPAVPERDAKLAAAETALRSRLTYTGSRLNFGDDGAWWLMGSADGNAVRGLLAVLDRPGWQTDLPRLMAGALARQARGHWDTTTANAWGSVALDQYGARFDKVKPTGKSTAYLGKTGRVVDWQANPNGASAAFPLPAQPTTLKLRHQGKGAPYVNVTTLAALDLKAPVARGYTVRRELVPVDQKTPGEWHRGDIVRVRLTVDARDDMGWVVIDDPVPAGASILGGGLKRDSAILTGDEKQAGDAWPAWQERRFDRFQAYYEYVPRGQLSLEYTFRLNNEGRFALPATRVEAMYAPEMYGETPNAAIVVLP